MAIQSSSPDTSINTPLIALREDQHVSSLGALRALSEDAIQNIISFAVNDGQDLKSLAALKLTNSHIQTNCDRFKGPEEATLSVLCERLNTCLDVQQAHQDSSPESHLYLLHNYTQVLKQAVQRAPQSLHRYSETQAADSMIVLHDIALAARSPSDIISSRNKALPTADMVQGLSHFSARDIKSILSNITTVDSITPRFRQKHETLRREAIDSFIPELKAEIQSDRTQAELEHYNQLSLISKCSVHCQKALYAGFSALMPDSVTSPLVGGATGFALGAAVACCMVDQEDSSRHFLVAQFSVTIGLLSMSLTMTRNLNNALEREVETHRT